MAQSWFEMDFGTGLVAGALIAFILFAAGRLWVLRLRPLVRQWRYGGINIAGEWEGLGAGYTPAHGEWSELVLSLQQDVCEVRGFVLLRCRSAGQAFDVRLHAIGRLTEGYLALSLAPAGESLPSPATALLKMDERGAALNGQLLYRHPLLDIVDVIDLSVHRTRPAVAPQLRQVGTAPAGTPLRETASLPVGTVLD